MSLHIHALLGCAPRPLASYLKALAVLRLVAEQKDPTARGFWREDAFHLATTLDEQALVDFFLCEWQPTALVSPWNKGSGFFSQTDKGLTPLRQSKATRFAPLREGIAAAASLLTEMDAAVAAEKAIKAESNAIKDATARETLRKDPVYKQRLARAARECKRLKDELQPECQRRWRGGSLRWLRAAVVLHSDDKPEFPALLGTGGNDGKLDFTNNAYQRLGDLFALDTDDGDPRPGAEEALRSSLWGDPTLGRQKGGIGQFSPAASGGANATSGPLAESLLNPWDLPLLLEGSVLFSASSTRRLAGRGPAQASAPFAVRGNASGYGSASATEDGMGTRGEQWMPLWERPWTLGELTSVLSEGRCQVGSRTGETATDVARAVARLGVARGVSSFERYGYLTRNGKSNYAVPLGRWEVRPEPRGQLLDDLDRGDWWGRVRRAARDDHAPGSFVRAERALADAALAALSHGDHPQHWAAVLLALTELEQQMVRSGAFTVKARLNPIPTLSRGWVRAADEGGPELRLALALAGAGRVGKSPDPVRAHWLPLDRKTGRFHTRERGLAQDTRVVCTGRDAEEDLVALVGRRLVEASTRTLPLQAFPGTSAATADLAALLAGSVDLERTVGLARALSALDWAEAGELRLTRPGGGEELDPSYLALRLTHLPFPLVRGGELHIPVDPSPLRLLAAGEASRAFEIVRRRLRAAGIAVPFRAVTLDVPRARRFAASLAFPLSLRTVTHFVRLLDPASSEELSHAC
jgi:CRISPR-associated protein Csx17